MGPRVVVQKVDSILLALEFSCDAVQLLAVEVSSDRVTVGYQLPVDDSTHAPPDAHRRLLRVSVGFGCCHSGFAGAEPLSMTEMASVEDPLLIPSNEVAQPLAVAIRGNLIHARVHP